MRREALPDDSMVLGEDVSVFLGAKAAQQSSRALDVSEKEGGGAEGKPRESG
jgi:hypothetical protein